MSEPDRLHRCFPERLERRHLRPVPRRRVAWLAALPLLSGCSDVQVGSPHSLWLLWLVPLLLVFFVYAFRTKTRLLERFASPEMLRRLTAGFSRSRQYLKAALVLLGVLACVVALAEPRFGFTWEEVKRQGVDIVVALDVSDSMLVEDAESGGKLSRLERARREITDLLRLLEGDRIGLVAFGPRAPLESEPLLLAPILAEEGRGVVRDAKFRLPLPGRVRRVFPEGVTSIPSTRQPATPSWKT